MVYEPKAGDIIKIHSWHGVILEVFTSKTGRTVLQVQTAWNVFRGYSPGFIEVEAAPETITPATRADLQELREVESERF
ncbi:MAG: hypothetical protein HC875_26250 [Anaerolineales bacterium]|nr:hypothetical protein [Anaerolineales bacterium]